MKAIYLSAAFQLVVLLAVTPTMAAETVNEEKPLAFADVNQQLFKNYSHAKEEIKATLGPVIYCNGSSISLHKGKDVQTVNFIKPRYTGLKEIDHITLGTFVILTNHTDENLAKDQLDRLSEYKEGILKAEAGLATNEGLMPQDEARQRSLIKTTVAFLSDVIANKRVSHKQLQAFVRTSANPDLDNAAIAVGTQMTTMDDTVDKWRKEMTPEEWKKLSVIIMTSHMPRNQLASYQFFAKLLNQYQEGERIIVAEGVSDENAALDLLLTHRLDGKIATEFFQDPWRMHRDLLSDGAREWLEKHRLKAQP